MNVELGLAFLFFCFFVISFLSSLSFPSLLHSLIFSLIKRRYIHNDLAQAAYHNDISFIKSQVCLGVSLNSIGLGGRTALMVASEWGLGRIVDYLIEKGADLNIIDDNNGDSALTLAYERYPDSPMVYKLIDAGADVNVGGDFCLLNKAIWNSDIRMLRKLLRIPTIRIPTYAGWNPKRNSERLSVEKEIQRIFEEAYHMPIAARTRGKQEHSQWRTILKDEHM